MDRDAFKSELVLLVEQIVQESGRPNELDTSRWIEEWFHQAIPALGSRPPSDFLNSDEGRELIRSLIKRMQSGAYS
jgi:hypothetical protein